MRRPGRCGSVALCLAAVILAASAASARTERFRWSQPGTSPVISAFWLYWGTSSGSYGNNLSVGIPVKDATGAYYYDLVVPDSTTIYVTVTAWSGGLESPRSNEISRAGITGGGGTTTPPPPSGTASSAVTGFALWNASNDTVVDTSFQNGEAIPDSVRSCASIEIKTNAYLNASGPGSIKKVFDGVDNGCSGSAVENTYPYAWEDDGGSVGQFKCAPSLSAIGNHTLTVTPYDGDNCSGLAGAPMTLSFTVSGPSSSGTTTLGTPGQPYVVP
jgi:hypothetical protein